MEYVNASQAAKVLGISSPRVTILIKKGRLKAEKLGYTWLILRADLEEFAKQPRPRGWKKGRPRKTS
jgi:excisionase family DNA binding protein